MKRLLTTTLLTVAAVPFLMAAPNAAKKAQNTATPAAQTKASVKKAHKKHVKKTASNSKPAPTADSNKK